MQRIVAASVALMITLAGFSLPARAGTTGALTGQVVDGVSHQPVAGVKVNAVALSQTVSAVTDAQGRYSLLSLAPDTYTITFDKASYARLVLTDVSIFADEVQTHDLALNASGGQQLSLDTRQSAGSELVRHGSFADVYSVNSATAHAAASLAGPGSLNQGYGALTSVPGVVAKHDQTGWFQEVEIRGGDNNTIGWEIDGVPVNFVFEGAPQHLLSALGQQELQVFTGGTPAYADATGLSGFVNQVIKTGTYPGFSEFNATVGGSSPYSRLSFEVGGASANRRLTYYFGLDSADQDFRYIDNNNGAGQINSFFYPVNALPDAGGNGVAYTGAGIPAGTPLFTNGNAFGIAHQSERDSVFNLHYAIANRSGVAPDDLQLLYLTNNLWAQFYSSQNDLGPNVVNALGQLKWNDSHVYTGALLQPFDPTKVTQYFFPNSQPHAFGSALPADLRDGTYNGFYLTKLQYQHNFDANSFLRAYAYASNSSWDITGPQSAAMSFNRSYGLEPADYERPQHTYGANVSFTDQINAANLLTASAAVTDSRVRRYAAIGYATNPVITTLVNASGNCVDATGAQVACYGPNVAHGTTANGAPFAAPAGAQWLVTENGLSANLAHADTQFTAASLSDQWRPTERLTVNLGARIENYRFLFGDTGANDPARQFWFTHYNAEHCFGPGLAAPVLATNNGLGPCPAGTSNTQLTNSNNASTATTRFQPRLGFAYDVDKDTVIRGSFGVYARPPGVQQVSFDQQQEDLASSLGSLFYRFNFTTPEHLIRPDTSFNYDLSLERQLPGTDLAFKITPFYRSTRDQIQNFIISSSGLESGLNVGHQVSSGVELALQKGDFDREGLSGRLSYTYTRSRINYNNFDGTSSNVIDQLNSSIQLYNSYTSACQTANAALCGSGTTNAQPSFTVGGVTIPNPYYNQPAQPLFDRNGSYTTYQVLPGFYTNGNGFETPSVASLILNYKHGRFAVTPSFSYSSGSSYGSPLSWEGYVPQSCARTLPNGAADPVACTQAPIAIPDPYTGKFDNLGAFKQPWKFSANLAFSYDLSPRVSAQLALTNLFDHCGQRGYAWDAPNICEYSNLVPSVLPPAGNLYPNSVSATPPAQLKYPYGFYYDLFNNAGVINTTLPMEFSVNLKIKV